MIRNDKTNAILRQFKKKSKKIINKDIFTEFFYFNKQRRIVEFLHTQEDILMIESFFKKLIPEGFREFIKLKVLNDSEENIKTWYYDNENAIIAINVNWGIKKQEISIDIDSDNFCVTVTDDKGNLFRDIDCMLLNEYIISFLTIQAQSLSQSFNILSTEKIIHKSKVV